MGFRALIASSMLSLVFSVPCAAVAGEKNPLQGTIWEESALRVTDATGRKFKASLIYAIALIESGRAAGGSEIAPWPLAINVDGKAFYPETKNEAIKIIESTGNKADVGLGQISLQWHSFRVNAPSDLLEPNTNIQIIADILIENFRNEEHDLELNVGRYHSFDESRARSYGKKVLSLSTRLEELWGPL